VAVVMTNMDWSRVSLVATEVYGKDMDFGMA
jgi:hypothetical protein